MNIWEKNFPCEDSQAKELVTQRGCAVSIHGGFQDPTVQKVLSNLDSAVSRRLGKGPAIQHESFHSSARFIHQPYTTADLSDCLCIRVCFPV